MRHSRVEASVVVTGLGLRVRRRSGDRVRRDAAATCELPHGATSRLTRTGIRGRFGAVAADAALAQSDRSATTASVFLIVSMERGSECDDRSYWATVADHGAAFASPAGFATTLPSTIAGEIAAANRLTGPCLVFAGDSRGALATAALIATDAPQGVTHVLLVVIRGEADGDDHAGHVRARAVLLGVTRAGASDVA